MTFTPSAKIVSAKFMKKFQILKHLRLKCLVLYGIFHCSEGKKEVSKLVEEADMPLDTLLAQYMAERVREGEGESGDEEMNEEGMQ